MFDIKVLDCTLRDGGYINNWEFGKDSIKNIYKNLEQAKIDYIEIGFLKDDCQNENKTLFENVKDVEKFVDLNKTSKTVAMIIFNQYDISKLPNKKDSLIDAIRVIFKTNQINEVFPTLEKIKNLGYELFINPSNIEAYNEKQLVDLIQKVNKIDPFCFSIVDTHGVLKEKDVEKIYNAVNNGLNTNIALCFHSHNNLQLSFSNAQYLTKINQNRNLIIDSSVYGMGRGAGNLCSELLIQYLNNNYAKSYNIIPILKIIDEEIKPIYLKTPWGYSIPYYLTALYHCHPNYAKYLLDKNCTSIEIINNILSKIPNEKKIIYDVNLAQQLYLDSEANS